MTSRFRTVLRSGCFGLGGIWAVAGAMKLLFGTAVTLPILPPLALERVDVTTSLVVALVWVILGALIGRHAPVRDRESPTRDRVL